MAATYGPGRVAAVRIGVGATSERRAIGLLGVVLVAAAVLGCSRGGSSTSSSTIPSPSPSSTVTTAPTTTTSLVEITEPTWFSTPSGNISCAMGVDWVRCDIVERDWSPPPKPADCGFDWGSSLAVEVDGSARFLCVSDTVYRPEVTVEYGSRVRVGAMSCDVLTSGVTCRSEGGQGFSLSREAHELF